MILPPPRIIGQATLYCGDSLALLESGALKFDALVSDPPFSMRFQFDGGGRGCRRSSNFGLGEQARTRPAVGAEADGGLCPNN